MLNFKAITTASFLAILGLMIPKSASSNSPDTSHLSDFRFYRSATNPTEFHNTTYDNDLTGVSAFQQFANTERNKINLSELEARVLDNSKLKLKYDSDVKVYFINEGAGYRNQLKLVTTGASNVDGMIFKDVSCRRDEPSPSCGLGSNGVTKENSLRLGDYVHVGELKAGTTLDFQVLQNGFGKTNPTTWYTTTNRNSDNLQHLIAYEYENYLILAWEDLTGGGDLDYNDVVFAVDIGKKNVDSINTENNAAPVAQDDLFTTDEDTVLTEENVLSDNGNGADTDPDGNQITVSEVIVNGIATAVTSNTQVTLAQGSILTISKDGSFSYDPNSQFETLNAGQDNTETFKYSIDDGNGGQDQAVVTMTIEGVADNETPNAVDDNANVDRDQRKAINVLQNDSDPDGDIIEIQSLAGQDVIFGQVSQEIELSSGAWVKLKDNGRVVYSPNSMFDSLVGSQTDTDSFTYTIHDGNGNTSTATVTMTIGDFNGSPDIVDDEFEAARDSMSVINVLNNDSDPDGDPLVVKQIRGETTGTVVISDDKKSVIYTPDPEFTGEETFEYQGDDGKGGKGWATVTVTVRNNYAD